jgi:hypothetical protein
VRSGGSGRRPAAPPGPLAILGINIAATCERFGARTMARALREVEALELRP